MQLPKLLIADGNEEYRQALEEMFRTRCAVKACVDGEEAMALLPGFRPDILVVDLMLPKTDGLSLLQALRKMPLRPMILAQTAFASPYVLERLQKLEVDYVMYKPCQMEAVEARLLDFLAQLTDVPPQAPDSRQELAGALLMLGISPKLDGYGYLLSAIPLFARDPAQSITKELYVAVGEPRVKDGRLVERSIRSAIEKAWLQRDEAVWRTYFCCGPDGSVPKPSNGTFISRLAQVLSGRMKEIHIA